MAETWLSARLVEQLHERVEDGEEIASVVAALRGATLPGLLEYGCMRHASRDSAPPLPTAVTSSPIGSALNAVPTPLGLRSSGRARRPLRRLDTQPVEFTVLAEESELEGEVWKAFEIRFNRSTRAVGFRPVVGDGLQGALHEMAENAVLHARAQVPTLIGYRVLPGVAQFCVADAGIGVLESLRSCPDFSYLRRDNEAIKLALRPGVSRSGLNRGGMGFREVFKALAAEWGTLRFRSGEGCLSMDGTDLDADHGREHFPPRLPGFQVSVCCRTNGSAPPEPLI